MLTYYSLDLTQQVLIGFLSHSKVNSWCFEIFRISSIRGTRKELNGEKIQGPLDTFISVMILLFQLKISENTFIFHRSKFLKIDVIDRDFGTL